MNYADIRPIDVANGPGVRVSLFVSGCTHRCEGCFNPETWDFHYGKPFGPEQEEEIRTEVEEELNLKLDASGRLLDDRSRETTEETEQKEDTVQ